jgi:GT2 family glycosyltransferase
VNDSVALAYVHSNAVTWSWHASMAGLWRWDLSHSGRIYRYGAEIEINGGTGGLVAARNQAVRELLAVESLDWLFWIDSDMGFAADTVDRLLETADSMERPIVGALCFAQKLPEADGLGGYRSLAVPTIYDWKSLPDDKGFQARLEYEADTLTRCAGTGSACILIHRSVFERMSAEYGPAWYDLVPNEGGENIGEDLSFCLRAATLKIPIHVHTGVKTSHYKGIWIDEEHYRTLRTGYQPAAHA